MPAGVEEFRIDGPLFFGVAAQLMGAYLRLGATPHVLIVRMGAVPMLAASGVAAIDELVRQADRSGVRLILCGLGERSRGMLRRAGLAGSGRSIKTAGDYAEALVQARAAMSAMDTGQPLTP